MIQPAQLEEGEGPRSAPLLRAEAVSKRYGGVQAVRDVSLEVRVGTVHALVGENGAGKSTFAKIIGGVVRPDAGRVKVDGVEVDLGAPRRALARGIVTMAQEIALLPSRSALDNVFLGTESTNAGWVRRRSMERRYRELGRRTGFHVAADARVGRLRLADQQKVEILRALARGARLIVMDEPTASLGREDAQRLLDIIRDMRAEGTAVIFVSHYLDQVLEVADTVTIMRDGQLVRTSLASDETVDSLVEGMVGRSLALAFAPKQPPAPDAPPALELRGVTSERLVDDVSMTVRRGEIVGLFGLVGSGRSELARAVFGADPLSAGTIVVAGVPLRRHSPHGAIAAGIAMVPESRKEQGLVLRRPILENTTLAYLDEVTWPAGVIRTRREQELASRVTARMNVRMGSLRDAVHRLSGGNQQKVLLGKWLMRQPKVLIVDEPTRGVDIGAKHEIHVAIAQLARDGLGVLLISSEVEEVLGLAHRVVVMRNGRVAGEFDGEQANENVVMAAAFGT